jgi:dihydrofolate synthase/folylpolyglutamate synthase
VSDTAIIESLAVDNPSLDDWLRWQESLNPRLMDLGLDRCVRVAASMGLDALPMPVVTVAGTNGKGSCVAYLTGILEGAGHAVAAYTSPYLHRYNESLRIDGREARDHELIAAFENVERCRGDVPLTFFEFRTLAALDIISRAGADVAVLEVGLGGRLDAVNIIDADVAVVTSIDLDHMDWLGSDRESIGREKAGIFRSRRPAVCGDGAPPESLVVHAAKLGADLRRVGEDYSWRRRRGHHGSRAAGPRNRRRRSGGARGNRRRPVARPPAGVSGRGGARRRRRPQWGSGAGSGRHPGGTPGGGTHGVIAMLADKDVSAVAGALAGQVDTWYTAPLPGPRGGTGEGVARALQRRFPGDPVTVHKDVATAWRSALSAAADGDRVVAFGSFLTAREILRIELG